MKLIAMTLALAVSIGTASAQPLCYQSYQPVIYGFGLGQTVAVPMAWQGQAAIALVGYNGAPVCISASIRPVACRVTFNIEGVAFIAAPGDVGKLVSVSTSWQGPGFYSYGLVQSVGLNIYLGPPSYLPTIRPDNDPNDDAVYSIDVLSSSSALPAMWIVTPVFQGNC